MSDPVSQPSLGNTLSSISKKRLNTKKPLMTANGIYIADIISTQGRLGFPIVGYLTDDPEDPGTELHQWAVDGEYEGGDKELDLVNVISHDSYYVNIYRNKKTGEFMTGEKKVTIAVDDVFNSTHQLEKCKTIEVDIKDEDY
jgi:hypothetical protein